MQIAPPWRPYATPHARHAAARRMRSGAPMPPFGCGAPNAQTECSNRMLPSLLRALRRTTTPACALLPPPAAALAAAAAAAAPPLAATAPAPPACAPPACAATSWPPAGTPGHLGMQPVQHACGLGAGSPSAWPGAQPPWPAADASRRAFSTAGLASSSATATEQQMGHALQPPRQARNYPAQYVPWAPTRTLARPRRAERRMNFLMQSLELEQVCGMGRQAGRQAGGHVAGSSACHSTAACCCPQRPPGP